MGHDDPGSVNGVTGFHGFVHPYGIPRTPYRGPVHDRSTVLMEGPQRVDRPVNDVTLELMYGTDLEGELDECETLPPRLRDPGGNKYVFRSAHAATLGSDVLVVHTHQLCGLPRGRGQLSTNQGSTAGTVPKEPGLI